MKLIVPTLAVVTLAGTLVAQTPTPPPELHEQHPALQPPADPKAPPTAPSPLQFDNLVHDWGVISDDEPVSHKFTFKNISTQTVNIKDTKTTCGCSVAAPSKRTLAPGEEASIDVTFTPKGKRGQELKSVTVTTDYAANPNQELHLKAFVRPRTVIEPSSLWFGDLPMRKGGGQEISIMNRTPEFKVTSFELKGLSSNFFTAEKIAEDTAELDGQQVARTKFRVTFTDSAPVGTHQASLIANSNDPKNPSYTISVGARVSGDIQIVPERVLVPMTAAGQPWNGETMLFPREAGKSFEIYSVEPIDTPKEMRVIVDLLPRDGNTKTGWRVRASGMTPNFITEIKGSIRVKTNVKDQEIIDIPLMGLWRGTNTGVPANPGIPGVGGTPVLPK